ncbi:MAG TPA: hypothetical protein DCX77_10390 [Acidimicrobiaceae bacterium]|nr:hypothetical protein [Acidimicrobiaceae bacterium]HAX06073.1 hypothetical protein [Acidimicrobiaceae bacterium]
MRSGPLVWVSLVVAALIVLWGIASVFVIPRARWQELERRQSNWVLMMFLFGPLAVLLFYGTVRQHLLWPERYENVDGVAPADR